MAIDLNAVILDEGGRLLLGGAADLAHQHDIPGLVVPADLTSGGLPVSLELDGPAGSDRRMLEIGLAVEALLGHIPPPAL